MKTVQFESKIMKGKPEERKKTTLVRATVAAAPLGRGAEGVPVRHRTPLPSEQSWCHESDVRQIPEFPNPRLAATTQ